MRITCIIPIAVLSAAMLSSCSTSQPEPTPAPAPAPTPVQIKPPAPAPKPVSGAWTEWPLAWVYRSDDRGSLALFGAPNSDATFMIRCDRTRGQIFLSRGGKLSANDATMTLRASSGLQSFPARNSGGAVPYAAIAVSTSEYMLDRIAFSRGRFAVETTGLPSLAIPIWPEFTRVVEDCRA